MSDPLGRFAGLAKHMGRKAASRFLRAATGRAALGPLLLAALFVAAANPDPNAAGAAAVKVPPSGGAALARAVSDLGIVKTVDRSTVHPGQRLVYTLTVTNHGPDAAHEVSVTDSATVGLTTPTVFVSTIPTGEQGCDRSPTFVSCPVGTLDVGASAEVRIYTEALRAGRVRDTARVTSASEDPHPANNVASLEVTVTSRPTGHPSPPRFTG